MLQFYYDFLDKYLERADFQMREMDTDSAYIAIGGDSVERLIKPELIAQFEQDNCNWVLAPIRQSTRPTIREPQDCLRLNGKGKE